MFIETGPRKNIFKLRRSGMFIEARRCSVLVAADESGSLVNMPLLRSLKILCGVGFYKHGAPNGACKRDHATVSYWGGRNLEHPCEPPTALPLPFQAGPESDEGR
jgi:hypothetical protein